MDSKRILIDTSVLIDHLRKSKKDETLFYRLSLDNTYLISVIVEFEFIVGCNPKNRQFIEGLLAILSVIPFDSACVKTASKIYENLKKINKLLSLPDIFIAATAMTHNLDLLTFNQKHFKYIENLKLFPL